MRTGQGYQLTVEDAAGEMRLAIRGRVGLENAGRILGEITAHLQRAPRAVALDLSAVDYFDSAGGAVVVTLRQRLAGRGIPLRLDGSTQAVDAFLALIDADAMESAAPARAQPPAPGAVTRIGQAAVEFLADAREVLQFTGEIMIGLWEALLHPGRVRWRETWLYMERAGMDALPIVALISFLMGLIMGFQAAVQMSQFGADIYVANLVGLAIVRELGPLLTAIIAAGRSGAAFAAEIGTMKVAEEVDALQVMGLDRARFLVTPKLLALVLMLPCLTLFADLVGILGGLTVGMAWLDLPFQVYMRQTRVALVAWDVYSGVVKSLAFAVLIAGIGCLRGFQAGTDAESVGRSTTSAVVSGLFLIILADAVFTVLFHYW